MFSKVRMWTFWVIWTFKIIKITRIIRIIRIIKSKIVKLWIYITTRTYIKISQTIRRLFMNNK